jgi:hypothetical protein
MPVNVPIHPHMAQEAPTLCLIQTMPQSGHC